MLQNFPHFQPINESNIQEYQDFISDYPVHCDFALNNLLIWFSIDEGVWASRLKGNLVLAVKSSIYNNSLDGTWYTVLGREEPDATLDLLFGGLDIDHLEMVPDYFVKRIRRTDKYELSEDRANRDYILSVRGLVQCHGKEYGQYRYQINKFRSDFEPRAKIRSLDMADRNTPAMILDGLKRWPAVVSFDVNGNDYSRVDELAISRLLSMQPLFIAKHKVLGLYVDGMLEGFSIYHIPPSRHCIALGNHIKYNATYTRGFDYLVHNTALALLSDGVTLLNGEQDMGIPGIRHHKQALNPIGYYKKYTIRPKKAS